MQPLIWMVRYFNWMLRWPCSLVINRVWQIRSTKEVGREAHGWPRTTSMPLDGVAKVIVLMANSLKLISAQTLRSMSFVIPFLASDSFPSSPGSWNMNVPGVAIGCVKACAGGLGRKNLWIVVRLNISGHGFILCGTESTKNMSTCYKSYGLVDLYQFLRIKCILPAWFLNFKEQRHAHQQQKVLYNNGWLP